MIEAPPKPASVLIIGSGPIVIGQAAEFDYAGTQACRALRGEGVRTILVNSNPATIMTDPEVADAIYLEPLTVEAVEAVIAKERPDGLLAGLGGQTALNLADALAEAGVLERYGVRLLGTPLEAIRMAEDREAFRDLLDRIGQPYAAIVRSSRAHAEDVRRARDAREIGLPAIVRPAFTLGGTGGGIVETEDGVPRADPCRPARQPDQPGDGRALPGRLAGDRVRGHARRRRHVHRRLLDGERRPARRPHRRLDRRRAQSRRCPTRSTSGCAARRSRSSARLGVEGGCNVQFALSPDSTEYAVIEVNPRVSRSSALASQGDGLPDRPGRGADRGRSAAGRDPERRDRHHGRRLRAGPRLRRRQDAALPVRQVPDAPTGRSAAR